MNLDLRDNSGFKTKQHRRLALKLLKTYTKIERDLLSTG